MSNSSSTIKKKKSNNLMENNATQFKMWCIDNGIEQKDIRRDTKLSIGCIHSTWNLGKATPSTVKLISLVYKLNEKELNDMIHTFVAKKKKKRVKK
jgi:hypothetical protein